MPPEAANPLIPTAYDVAWTLIAAIMVVLPFIALASILKNSKSHSSQRVVSIVLVFLFPMVGPLGWFAMLACANARSQVRAKQTD